MTKGIQKIAFHYLVPPFYFPNREKLKAFLIRQLRKDGKDVEVINYVFCDDAYLLEINKQYLNHDTLTDIITFELSPKSQPLVADIYISVERIKENASIYKSFFIRELHRVIFHGALHLIGYKDKSNDQAKKMREKEEEYLAIFFSRGTYHKRKD
jgi:rRNA maturation RNase YbeY